MRTSAAADTGASAPPHPGRVRTANSPHHCCQCCPWRTWMQVAHPGSCSRSRRPLLSCGTSGFAAGSHMNPCGPDTASLDPGTQASDATRHMPDCCTTDAHAPCECWQARGELGCVDLRP